VCVRACVYSGCTSSDNKVEALLGLGVEAFNYRSTSIDEALSKVRAGHSPPWSWLEQAYGLEGS
jgi:hypothetical protein